MTVTIQGAGDSFNACGANDTVNIAEIAASTTVSFTNGGRVSMVGTGSSATVNGNDVIVFENDAGDAVSLTGTGNTVFATGGTISQTTSGTSVTIIGNNDTANAVAGDTTGFIGAGESMIGSNDMIYEGANTSVTIIGQNDMAQAVAGDTASFSGTRGNVTGSNVAINEITAAAGGGGLLERTGHRGGLRLAGADGRGQHPGEPCLADRGEDPSARQDMSVTVHNDETGHPTQITVYAGGGSTIHDVAPGIGSYIERAISAVLNIAAVVFPETPLPYLAAALDAAQSGQAFANGEDRQGVLNLAQAVANGINGVAGAVTPTSMVFAAAVQGLGGVYGVVQSAESGNAAGILAGAPEAAAAGATGIGMDCGGRRITFGRI